MLDKKYNHLEVEKGKYENWKNIASASTLNNTSSATSRMVAKGIG